MSKSDDNPKSRILITDSEADISKKIRSALTDSVSGISHDSNARPGVSNLLDILFHVSDSPASSWDELVADCKDLSMQAFKEKVADSVEASLRPIRERYSELLNRQQGRFLDLVAEQGATKARESAAETMRQVRDAIGL